MAVALTPGQAKPVTLAATVTRLTGLSSCCEITIAAPSTADVYVVDDQAVTDAAALPANYFRIPSNQVVTFRLAPGTAHIGVAASTGTPACHVRPL